MFDDTFETRRARGNGGRATSVGAAAGIHLFVAALAIGGSYLILQDPPEFQIPQEVFLITPPPVDGGGGLPRPPRDETAKPPRPTPPDVLVQPQVVPDAPPATQAEPEGSPDDLGTDIGGPFGAGSDGPPGIGGPGDGPGTGPGPAGLPGPRFLEGDMTPPRLLARVEPAYPEVLRRARVPGTTVVQAVIGEDGRVESVEILSASNPLFVIRTRAAVLRWRYTPALQSGSPVRVYFTVRVEFEVR